MMTAVTIIVVLLALQNAAQLWWINKLLNKLMSRNYQDYKFSEQILFDKKKSDKIASNTVEEGYFEDPNAVVQ
jgi:hypothetical protein